MIERDNQVGPAATIKKIYRVKLADLMPVKLGETLPVVAKEEVLDLIPTLKSLTNGYVVDKVEGLAFDKDGNAWIVTDNDGNYYEAGEACGDYPGTGQILVIDRNLSGLDFSMAPTLNTAGQ